MAVTNITASVEPILNQWRADAYEDLTYRDHPLTGMVDKQLAGGKTVQVSLKYGQNAGRSASFAKAQANEADVSNIEFTVYPGIDYALSSVPNPEIELSANDRGAVVRLLTDRGESNHRNLSDSVERDLFGSGYGTLGRIATGGISSATMTCETSQQVVNFYKNQKVNFASSEAASSMRTSGTALTVLSTDIDAKTVTFTAGIVATLSDVVAGDYAFQEGDKTNATRIKLTGLAGWIPSTAPSPSESFFGVDRSSAATQLAGWRVDGSALKITEALNRAVARIGTFAGSKVDAIYMSPNMMVKFMDLLSTRDVYVDVQGKGITLSYSGIKWMSARGPITVFTSPFCPDDKIYVLSLNSFHLGAPRNKLIQTANKNGNFVDVYNADAVEIRDRALGFFWCDAPGFNAVITGISAAA